MRGLRIGLLATGIIAASTTASLAQDAAAGEKVFNKCKACHQVGESAKNAVGPVLNGVVDRQAGTYPGFSYSDANKGVRNNLDGSDAEGIFEGSARKSSGHEDGVRRPDEGRGHR